MKKVFAPLLALLLSCSSSDVQEVPQQNITPNNLAPPNTFHIPKISDKNKLPSNYFDKFPPTKYPMEYLGGPVMTKPINIYIIWYGNWETNTSLIVEEMFDNIGNSEWLNINSSYFQKVKYVDLKHNSYKEEKQYVNTHVTLVKSIKDNYSLGQDLLEQDVRNIVIKSITDGKFPLDNNGIYFLFSSEDVNQYMILGGWEYTFCSEFCGWHNSYEFNDVHVKYSFVGDVGKCPRNCSLKDDYMKAGYDKSPNDDWSADGMISIIAHELAEAMTNPLPLSETNNSWRDIYGYENADKCAWIFGETFSTKNGSLANVKMGNNHYMIQKNWVLSNPDTGSGYCALKK